MERPINARLVRGTWLFVALPLLLAAFTVGRPESLPPPTLPPGFDRSTAEQLTRELARDYPDRAPGSAGALGAATWVAEQLSLHGFEPQLDRFSASIPGIGPVELQNIVAVVPGVSQRAIVITAHRDNTGRGRGANDNASGTAALIELARAYAPAAGTTTLQAQPSNTLVFVSTDGGAFGALGAARFADSSPYRDDALAVLSLDAVAGLGEPRLVIAGDTARSPAAALVRTAAVRIEEQTGSVPARASAFEQLLQLGFPFTLGEQGPFVTRGVPALTVTTLADVTPQGFVDDPLSSRRLGELGRAAQTTIGSLDAGLELAQGTTSYIYLGGRIVQGWAIQLVLLTALLPFAIGAIDLFARCRRRRIKLAAAARSLRSRLVFWGYGALLLFVAATARRVPGGRGAPAAARRRRLPALTGRAGRARCAASGRLARGARAADPPSPRPARGDSSRATPSHCSRSGSPRSSSSPRIRIPSSTCSRRSMPGSGYRRSTTPAPSARAGLLVLGLAGPVVLLLTFATRLDLGLETPWYLLSLVAVGYVPWIVVLVGVVWFAVAGQLAALAAGRYAPYPDVRRRPRNPLRAMLSRRRSRPGRADALEG